MAQIGTGHGSYIKLANELTYGTKPGALAPVRIRTDTLAHLATATEGNTNLMRLMKTSIKPVQKRRAGDLSADLTYGAYEWLFYHFFGGYTFDVTGHGTNGKGHTFWPNAVRPGPGLSIESHDGIQSVDTLGTRIRTLGFEITNNVLRATWGALGLLGTGVGSYDPAPDFGDPGPDVCPIEDTNGLTTTYGGSALDITRASISGQLSHTENRERLGHDRMLEPVVSDFMGITGQFQREIEDGDHYTALEAGTIAELKFDFLSDVEIDSGENNYFQQTLTMAEILLTEVRAPAEGPGPRTETVSFESRAPIGSANGLVLDLVNTVDDLGV